LPIWKRLLLFVKRWVGRIITATGAASAALLAAASFVIRWLREIDWQKLKLVLEGLAVLVGLIGAILALLGLSRK
jgi:hypothetical protein